MVQRFLLFAWIGAILACVSVSGFLVLRNPPFQAEQLPYVDYREYKQTWEEARRTLTYEDFLHWVEEHSGQQVLISGPVYRISEVVIDSQECIVSVNTSRLLSFSFAVVRQACGEVRHMKEGDPIRVLCTVTGQNFFSDPLLELCRIL